jgi:hypothetical protein
MAWCTEIFFAEILLQWIHLMCVFMYVVDETGINTACLRHFRVQLKNKFMKYTELTTQIGQCKNLHAQSIFDTKSETWPAIAQGPKYYSPKQTHIRVLP